MPVARGIARAGVEILGLVAAAPKATSGEHDAHWEFFGPHRILAFEVKMAPVAQRVVNADIELHERAGGLSTLAESPASISSTGLRSTSIR